MGGVRCDLCSNGPCRADAEKDKRGVCGITDLPVVAAAPEYMEQKATIEVKRKKLGI